MVDRRLARVRSHTLAAKLHDRIMNVDGPLAIRSLSVAEMRRLCSYLQILVGRYDRKDDLAKKLWAEYDEWTQHHGEWQKKEE